MRIFYDTEFIDDGKTIDLISLAAVNEYGHIFYAVSTEYDAGAANCWVRQNVLPKLPYDDDALWMSRDEIADSFLAYLEGQGEPVELWANYSAYDHVALAQLWGPMVDLPREIPMFTNDLQQLWWSLGCPELPEESPDSHHAVADAQWTRAAYSAMVAGGAA